MLQSIREHTHGFIAGLIISLLILSFALWGIHSYFDGGASKDIAAKVNGTIISKRQLVVTYERLAHQTQLTTNNSEISSVRAQLKMTALQTLIEIEALKQAAIAAHYRISSTQVDNFLENMPEFQVDGVFSLGRFKEILNGALFTPEEFLNLVKESLLIAQPRLGITLSSFALPNEVNTSIALIQQKRNIDYFIVPYHYFADSILFSKEELRRYYDAHLNTYKTKAKVKIEYVIFSANALIKNVHPDEENLRKYYTENNNLFLTRPVWKLESIFIPIAKKNVLTDVMVAIQNNQSFAKIKNQYHLTDFNANWRIGVTLDKLPQEIQKSIVDLKTINTISKPMLIDKQGFVIVKVFDYTPSKQEDFNNVKDKVSELYVKQMALEKFAELKDRFANVVYEHPESLSKVAMEFKLPIQSTGFFDQEKGIDEITKLANVREVAFSHDVLDLKNNSEPFALNANTIISLRVSNYIPVKQLPFEAVQKNIALTLKAKMVKNKTVAFAEDLLKKLQTKVISFKEINKQYHFSVTSDKWITRNESNMMQALLQAAFATPRPLVNNFTYSSIKVPNGIAILKLNTIQNGAIDNSNLQMYQAFSEQLQNTTALMEYTLYQQSVLKDAKIEVIQN